MATVFTPQFQIVSDLHLETPLQQPSYRRFQLNLLTNYLCLLGDIGLVKDDGLFVFLERLLKQTPNLTIFYVLGNHEAYQTTLKNAHKMMLSFAERMSRKYGRRLIIMNRTRYDINSTISILGCTLWTKITDEQVLDTQKLLTDFNASRGIHDWSLESHLDEHRRDLEWLNSQVASIEGQHPERQIIILTHHSPTIDSRVNDPQHKESGVRSGFVTDLSQEKCWTSAKVRLWAFGHTHFSSHYHEAETGKLVFSNQRGYSSLGASEQPTVEHILVEASGHEWKVIASRKRQRHRKATKRSDALEQNNTKAKQKNSQTPKAQEGNIFYTALQWFKPKP